MILFGKLYLKYFRHGQKIRANIHVRFLILKHLQAIDPSLQASPNYQTMR